jgi:hypothetical protein
VGEGSGKGGVVAVGVGSGRDGEVGVDVDEGGGGSCVEQPETIKAADTKMTAITRPVDIAFSRRDSILNPSVKWDCARKSCFAKAALCLTGAHTSVRPYHPPSFRVILKNPETPVHNKLLADTQRTRIDVAQNRHIMAFLQRAAFYKKAWSKALPHIARLSASCIVLSYPIQSKCPIGRLCLARG